MCAQPPTRKKYIVRSFKFILKVGVEESIVNALFVLRITDQLFKSYIFTRMVRSQSTLQKINLNERTIL
jgi:hypothetical protein